jgi:hypothetical protein
MERVFAEGSTLLFATATLLGEVLWAYYIINAKGLADD